MKKKNEDNSNNSSIKTNSSSINEDTENDKYQKTRARGGIKSKANNFQAGRNTICVPMSNFSGISSNASFQSKLLFFNGGKPPPKQKKIGTSKAITEESEKKNKIEKDDINSNININNLLNSKNNNNINSNININNLLNSKNNNNKSNNSNTNANKNKDLDNPRKYTFVKKNSVSFSSNQINSLIASFDTKPSSSNNSGSGGSGGSGGYSSSSARSVNNTYKVSAYDKNGYMINGYPKNLDKQNAKSAARTAFNQGYSVTMSFKPLCISAI